MLNFIKWITESGDRPMLVVETFHKGVVMPSDLYHDKEQAFCLDPNAIRNLKIDRSTISFVAYFSGNPFTLTIPHEAIVDIYGENSGSSYLDIKETTSNIVAFVKKDK